MTDFTMGVLIGLIIGVLATLAVLFVWGGEPL